MRHKYLYVSERGFANEYAIYRVTPDQERTANELKDRIENDVNGRCCWITRKEAERLTAQNRRAYRLGEANHQNPAGATEISAFGS